MPLTVLIVDDSQFFQQRLTKMLSEHPDLTIAGVASNGREAVEMAEKLRPDVITMDFEMPVMDGVTAVRHIMANRPVPILMFSSLTYEGARITLDALEAGAVDFIPKNFADVSRDSAILKKRLHDRILTIARDSQKSAVTSRLAPSPAPRSSEPTSAPSPAPRRSRPVAPKPVPIQREVTAEPRPPESRRKQKVNANIVVIGASTGGPVALTDVLTSLPGDFSKPIVLVQHMPENFTKAFADRLNKQCQIQVREAKDGDQLRPGLALLAPGGKQLMVDNRGGGTVRVLPGDERVNYKPSVDITFGSAANAYGNRVLGIVLTGMGADGCEGARLLKRQGATIWSQDKDSCVIYGMPMAVARAGLSDEVLDIDDVGSRLKEAL